MPELLLELFSEEIPARMQPAAAANLERLVLAQLGESGLTWSRARSFVTPRRLTLVVDELPAQTPERTEERRGPFVGAPENAIAGFLKSAGLASVDACEVRTVGKTDYYYAVRRIAGRPTPDVVAAAVPAIVRAFPWPKSMRWGSGALAWVRPLESILCLFDGEVVPVDLDAHGLRAGATTRGHRFMAPQPFAVSGFEDYRAKLREAYVVLDRDERKERITSGIARLAAAEGLRPVEAPAIVEEICGLVEWPVPLIGTIDERFMTLPREVLTTTMRANQKYVTMERGDGAFAPRFAVVANLEPSDAGAQIVAGNERVLRSRLSDAEFFWNQDRRTRLEDRLPHLSELVFQERLGTMLDKARRLESLAPELSPFTGAPASEARRAALLCKADLVSGMVREFPELQGVMGRYYALHDGEPVAVAVAIGEHYSPQGPSDRCPAAPVSVTTALADKLDTLVGFFLIDEKPTGSRDPYALRRAALGVIRLVVENALRVPLLRAFAAAAGRYAESQPAVRAEAAAFDGTELLAFFLERLRADLRDRGVPHDVAAAVLAAKRGDDLVSLLERLQALRDFLDTEEGATMLAAYRRASNIVTREEKRDGVGYDGDADPALLVQEEERTLFEGLRSARERIGEALGEAAADSRGRERFTDAMREIGALRPAIDAFFDRVTVNAEEPALRANRLRIVAGVRSALELVADFSKIER
ncbi:MAG TPA: glycine--tRNA ligase subunit beta [Candidatus Baltobacteraceae bacterium]|nr:glycine--tRNA ligase subunit beta [Candidatus Baltobacteraceae bacterium]